MPRMRCRSGVQTQRLKGWLLLYCLYFVMPAVSGCQDPVVHKPLCFSSCLGFFLIVFLVSEPDYFPLLIFTGEILLTWVETWFPVVIKSTGARIKEGFFFWCYTHWNWNDTEKISVVTLGLTSRFGRVHERIRLGGVSMGEELLWHSQNFYQDLSLN